MPTKEITFVGVLKNLFVNIKESRFVGTSKNICAYKGEQLSGVVSREERGLPPAREGHPTSRATDPKHLDLFGNSKMDLFGTGIFILAEEIWPSHFYLHTCILPPAMERHPT